MRYISYLTTGHNITTGFGNELEDADSAHVDGLAAAMAADGFDAKRPVILILQGWMFDEPQHRWGSQGDALELMQGRHRWLAAQTAGLEQVAAILLSQDEWEHLAADVADANDVEEVLMARLEELMEDEGEDIVL